MKLTLLITIILATPLLFPEIGTNLGWRLWQWAMEEMRKLELEMQKQSKQQKKGLQPDVASD